MDNQKDYWDAASVHLKVIGMYSPELVAALREAVQKGEQFFPYQKRVFSDQDVIDYKITFNLNPAHGWIVPATYTASLRATHPLGHEEIAGVNFAELEARLAAHPWEKEHALPTISGPKLQALGDLAQTATALSILLESEHPEAKDVGKRLAARYWLNTPMEKVLDLAAVAERFDRTHEFILEPSKMMINADKAYSLLSGGSVATLSEELQPCWAYMDFTAPATNRLVYVHDLSLKELLKEAPFKELQKEATLINLINGLMDGKKIPVHEEAGQQPLYVHVDAARKQLVLSDGNGNTLDLPDVAKKVPFIWEKGKMHDFPSLSETGEGKRKGMGI